MKTMKKWMVAVAAAGGIVLAAPLVYADDVRMDDLPRPVRDTVQREIGQGQISEIERDREPEGTVYEVEYRENGQKFELDVGEDGHVIRRHPD